jgi:SAM-dependent methyltransferase
MTSQFDIVSDSYEASEELPLREHLEHHSIRTLAGDLTGRGALDIGCGTGVYTRRLARWGARPVVGMDISDGMLDAARTVEAAAPLGITYLCQDLTAPRCDHQVAQVDLALSVYVLCYSTTFDGMVAMCRLARESLAPGGRFLAATLNPDYADEAEHPGYYKNLRIALSAHNKGPRLDGTQVTLSMRAIDDADPITSNA